MLEKDRACPRILSKDKIGFLKDPDGPESHVFKIAYRSRHYI
jgi:hypothetical protein